MSDSVYCYPGTDVLINHFGIRDRETLERVERDFTSANMALLIDSPVKGNFDFKHLQAIHHAIFHDVYPFAGQNRSVAIAKSNLFCLPQFILPMAYEIFGRLRADNCLRGLDKDAFVDKLAFYSGEINALHPFREGNGRTQRLFMQELSKAAGYQLLFAGIDGRILLQADIEAMSGRYESLKKLYGENVKPVERDTKSPENKPSVLERIEADRKQRKAGDKAPPRKAAKKKDDLEI